MKRPTALAMATVVFLGGAACGGGAAVSVSPSPLAPKGGPVPVELAGAWKMVADPTNILTFSGIDYVFGDGSKGNVAVNGSEINFYNDEPCDVPLPGGIGKYRWTIETGLLTFGSLNSDRCARLNVLVDPQGWQRSP